MAHRPLLTALIGLCVASCATPTKAPLSEPPMNYRQITANYVAGLPMPLRYQGALISSLRESIAPQPADWFACLRLKSGLYYAVFFAEGKLQDFRQTVRVDRCPETDQLLPAPKVEKPK